MTWPLAKLYSQYGVQYNYLILTSTNMKSGGLSWPFYSKRIHHSRLTNTAASLSSSSSENSSLQRKVTVIKLQSKPRTLFRTQIVVGGQFKVLFGFRQETVQKHEQVISCVNPQIWAKKRTALISALRGDKKSHLSRPIRLDFRSCFFKQQRSQGGQPYHRHRRASFTTTRFC